MQSSCKLVHERRVRLRVCFGDGCGAVAEGRLPVQVVPRVVSLPCFLERLENESFRAVLVVRYPSYGCLCKGGPFAFPEIKCDIELAEP